MAVQSSNSANQELRDARFAEIVRYAQTALGGNGSNRASQRELAEALGIAPTMVTRYLSSNCDWRNLKATTIEALAKAARLEVGTLFVWIADGRDAAMVYERRMSSKPRAFHPVDLARELASMLEASEADSEKQYPAPVGPDYEAIQQQLQQLQGPAFDRLVEVFDAAAALQAVEQQLPLEDEHWLALARLLNADPAVFRQQFAARSGARTQQPAS
jgi:transcriptional regulator with XRE-family HTH domain